MLFRSTFLSAPLLTFSLSQAEQEKIDRREAQRAGTFGSATLASTAALAAALAADSQRLEDEIAENGEDEDEVLVADPSLKLHAKSLRKVLEASDVLIEVLDARDPVGTRCRAVERELKSLDGGRKKLVLVLNKIGASRSFPLSQHGANPCCRSRPSPRRASLARSPPPPSPYHPLQVLHPAAAQPPLRLLRPHSQLRLRILHQAPHGAHQGIPPLGWPRLCGRAEGQAVPHDRPHWTPQRRQEFLDQHAQAEQGLLGRPDAWMDEGGAGGRVGEGSSSARLPWSRGGGAWRD